MSAHPRAMRVSVSALVAGSAALGLFTGPAYATDVPAATGATAAAPATESVGTPKTTAERSAGDRARTSGEPVEVVAERTAYSTTVANPDGTFTLTQSTTPQRVRGDDGTWRPVDVNLERRADGTVGPKAAVADVAFSGGGEGELIRLGSAPGALRLGWREGRLPEPSIEGATATYTEVFEGVDLRLTATAEGYREVLVVKTREAAANPALHKITLSTAGEGLRLTRGAGGGMRALDANGNTVFSGPAGRMWDSAGDQDAGPQPQLLRAAMATPPRVDAHPASESNPEPDPESQDQQPGEGDDSAPLPVTVGNGTVSVSPDLELLRGDDTVYPVFIDPPMGLALAERTVLSSDGDTFYGFNGDLGVGNCNRLGPWYCGTNYTNRMYFEFAPTNLAGKYVVDAVFRAYETWSFSCTSQWVDLWRTNNISEGSKWPGPAQLDLMGDRHISAGRGADCDPDQPDRWVEFQDNPAEPDENLTSTVRAFADGKMSRLTLMLRAKDEGDPDAWKRFDDNAELQINYVPRPGLPTPYGVIPGYGASRHCNPENDPLITTRSEPVVEAGTQTLVPPQSNGFKGSLRANFDAERYDPVGKKWVGTWEATSPSTGFSPDGTLEAVTMSYRADGILYRVRMRTLSYWTHEGKTSSMASAYTPWCYFKTDYEAPKAPRVDPASDSPYSGCTACVGEGGPGTLGTFRLRPNDADKDVIGFRYWVVPGKSTAQDVTLAQAAAVSFTPKVAGEHRLYVQAKDVRERFGDTATFAFKVKPGDSESARWRFAESASQQSSKKARDTGPKDSATPGGPDKPSFDATLNGGADWSGLGRRGAGDSSLTLSDPAQQHAFASTSSSAVNTRDSFTVSAWAYLTDTSSTRVVLSAPGEHDTAFTLYYSAGYKKWAFNRGAKDEAGTADVVSYGDAVNPPVKVWTHLTGVFNTKGNSDKSDDTIQLYVNGRPQGSPVRLAASAPAYEPWASPNGLQFGRTKANGSYQNYFRGSLDEVAVWQRALSSDEIRAESEVTGDDGTPATTLVADWNAESAAGTEIGDKSGYGRPALKLSSDGAELEALPDGGTTLVLDGNKGYAYANGPVVDETGSFTVSARVRVDRAKWLAKPVGYSGMVAGQKNGGQSSWALWLDKIDLDEDGHADYRWRFERTAVDGAGKVTATAAVRAIDVLGDEGFDSSVDVTAVFDATLTNPADASAAPGELRLFIGANPESLSAPAGLTSRTQGSNELAAGRGSHAGRVGHHFPGSLDQLRIWAGALREGSIGTTLGTT
ncbi:LamG-like jellyroll fold domain-containing protein [Streptomyces sp. SCSIO 30461]|uniref:LamG-like jellyroll fold domain-containing protein n=1 Tax=Streptomyces sp. SCSIO 30461 TaxID=3118085 RepID=UPI0030D24D6C